MADHLSPKQRITLRDLKRAGAEGWVKSSIHPTLLALERKGYATSDAGIHKPGFARWTATDKPAP